MKLYNSLTRKIEDFTPIVPPTVGMYTCGPTVYDYATIGNFRTYTTADFLLRALNFFGFKVKYVMNLTDVGHLTGDNLGDADTGEDRLEKSAKKEGKTAWDVARFYTDAFLTDFEKLNLTKPIIFTKATDHIAEQIELIRRLGEKGLTYKITDGIYFDTVAYEKTGKKYGELSTLDQIKEGARVEPNPEKKNPRDFALWKFDAVGRRQMEWESPWGVGFPGWHIECSAMSMKYLGETFDIHTGGEDLRSIHHPNEIAQSEGATDKLFVKYWVHGAFMKIDGKRMGKSLGNAYTVSDLEKKGISPMVLRYFYMTAHYRDPLNFTWEAINSAKSAYEKLLAMMEFLRTNRQRTVLSDEKENKVIRYQQEFKMALENDLNMPQTLSVLWEAIKSNIPSEDKYDLALTFDEVLGLKLSQLTINNLPSNSAGWQFTIPEEIQKLLKQREELRKEGNYGEADKIRREIEKLGFKLEDSQEGVKLKKI